jgi:hypothetical protein
LVERNSPFRANDINAFLSARCRDLGIVPRESDSGQGLIRVMGMSGRLSINTQTERPENYVLAASNQPLSSTNRDNETQRKRRSSETYASTTRYPQLQGTSAASFRSPSIDNYSGFRDESASPSTHYDMPSTFPYYQDSSGAWVCKFCDRIPQQFREPHYVWSHPSHSPPTGDFIDFHLSLCQGYQQVHTSQSERGDYSYEEVAYTYQRGRPTPSLHSSDVRDNDVGADLHTRIVVSQYDPITQRSATMRYPDSGGREYRSSEYSALVGRARYETVAYLLEHDKSGHTLDGLPIQENAMLVLEEDKLILTDYFFWIMKQLRMTRFAESDRKTRGGKRETVQLGYGGLECVHCAGSTNPRKFFWSNVDRLANSFAEIPSHTLKCRKCPQPIKDALLSLKETHAEEMATLPRGSQKVFFRRMWRRLHEETSRSPERSKVGEQQELSSSTETAQGARLKANPTITDSPGTLGSDETHVLVERPAHEAARVLAAALIHEGPPSPSSRVLLAIPEDKEWLSDTDCFIRRQIEVFAAVSDDVTTATVDRKIPVREGQVGIRCVHCALANGATGHAVSFPFSINGIYEAVREFQRLHLDTCANRPAAVAIRCSSGQGSSSLSSVLRKYYVLAARALGLRNTAEGIRAGGQSFPLGSQAAFEFADTGSPVSKISAEMHRHARSSHQHPSPYGIPTMSPHAAESRKRDSTTEINELEAKIARKHSKNNDV